MPGRRRPGGTARPGGRLASLGAPGAVARAAHRGDKGADGIVRCDEQLPTLVLLADAELARLLSGQVLAPLRGLRPEQADRLAETLLAWLESADNAGGRRAACTSTRRPCATGCDSSPSCSATP